MNLITLIDNHGNEIIISIDGISSCSFMRDGNKVVVAVTVFMKSGEKHSFSAVEAIKLDEKLKTV